MGTDPSEFLGANPFVASIELQMKADYANTDSLKRITKELKRNEQVTDITYPQDLMDSVTTTCRKSTSCCSFLQCCSPACRSHSSTTR